MPITKAAKKAVKKNITRRKANVRNLNLLKKTKKDFLKLVKEGKIEEAKKMAPNLYKTLDKAAKTNLIKKNKANRDKSRLMKKLKEKKK
ncbi:MAG: 30S ribosomal protein S20 [Candidatus Pacebacteria bacterium]|jgi:small subunit ribosomal protein S20|nr:30S ribosomal protein S20 [Candidatus Paceibacterota bacterium]MDD3491493.1 30S ribosomal protein S20 [Candidatus Paceibacterota bacterium]